MSATSSPKQPDRLPGSDDWQAVPSADTFQAAPRNARSKRMRLVRRIGWNLLPPLTFIAMVGLWWAVVVVFKIPAYLLPGPGGVFSRLVSDAPVLWANSQVTLIEILLG